MSDERLHIGVVAAGKRDILPGYEYDMYFPKPDNENTIVDRDGTVTDTMFQMGKVLGKYYKDTAKLAPLLKSKTLKDTCKNIFDFVYNHIQYELDKPGEEQLRRPARAWSDRQSGVDCDCYSIFIASILMNLGIPYKLRITKYDGKLHFQHVYVIVPHAKGYYTIDPVLDTFNYEKQFSGYKDFTMGQLGIPIAVLHGFEGTDTNILDDLLSGGLGNSQDAEKEIYEHLLKTKATIENNPGIIDSVDYAPGFLQMLEYAIENYWKGPKARAKAFEVLAWNEAQINSKMGVTEDDLNGFSEEDEDEYLLGIVEGDNVTLIDDDDVYDFDANGNVDLSGKKERQERKKKRKEKRSQKRADKKQRKAESKAERKEEKAGRKAERKAAKGFFRKIGVSLKQGGRAFVKYNPVVVAGRNGFLVALKTNMFKMSTRLKWGYASAAQAKQAGISPKRHAAAKNALKKVEKMFDQKLQGSKVALKKAILSGKHNLSGFSDKHEDFSGLGAVEAGMVAAALPIIYGVVKIIGDEVGPVENAEGEGDIYSDTGMDKNQNDDQKKGFLKNVISKIFKKKDTQSAIQEVNQEFPLDDEPADPPEGTNGFFDNVKSFVIANPLLAAGIGFGLAYMFIPPVRNGVNNLVKGGSQKEPAKPRQETAGLGEVKTIKFK